MANRQPKDPSHPDAHSQTRHTAPRTTKAPLSRGFLYSGALCDWWFVKGMAAADRELARGETTSLAEARRLLTRTTADPARSARREPHPATLLAGLATHGAAWSRDQSSPRSTLPRPSTPDAIIAAPCRQNL